MCAMIVFTLLLLLVIPKIQSEDVFRLIGKSHELSASNVQFVNDGKTLLVTNLVYDGLGPDVRFWLGTGDVPDVKSGVLLLDENGSDNKLHRYDSDTIKLAVTEEASRFDLFALICVLDNEDIGHVRLKRADKSILDVDSVFSFEPVTLPGLSGLAKSKSVQIMKPNVLLVEELSYIGDGEFRFGFEPSNLNYLLPYDGNFGNFSRDDVWLTVPDGLEVKDFDVFGIWSPLRGNVGSINLHSKAFAALFELEPLSSLQHGVRSGPVFILNETSIRINNLYYDGIGPDAHFWVGNGTKGPDRQGILVADENGSMGNLNGYKGKDVVINLPKGITVHDIDYIGLWCIEFSANFGYTSIPKSIKRNRQIGSNSNFGMLPPFSQLAHGLKSGPILILDEKTFFVTNLHYDGKGPDAHFWVGNGSSGPDQNGILVPNEHDSRDTLNSYNGEDVLIRLPEGITVKNIDYFGVWCIEYKHNFGYTNLINVDQITPKKMFLESESGKRVAIMQRCCQEGYVKSPKGCVFNNVDPQMPDYHEGNNTIFDDEAIPHVMYRSYTYQPKCPSGMYYLDPLSEEFRLLTSGELLVEDQLYKKDKYCFDPLEFSDQETGEPRWIMTAFLCFPEENKPKFVAILIASCIYVSAFFLIITSGIFIFIKDARDVRGLNVVGYSITMALSFICLSTAKLIDMNDKFCSGVGYVYQICLVSAFSWLCCLIVETYYQVVNYNNHHWKWRTLINGIIAVGIPILFLLLSLVINDIVPSKFSNPKYSVDSCWFRSDKKVVFYYLPIVLSILFGIIFTGLTYYKIRKIENNRPHPSWTSVGNGIKNVFRSCYLLLAVMTACWIAEVISYFYDTGAGIWIALDVIQSLQGLFVFIIFILHNPVVGILKVRWNQLIGKSPIKETYSPSEMTHLNP
ncbi:PREDICTED: uncharacterized protein LOC108567537 [Nicrophorus vespilloides]|uniref:Uncharacterized protein LOC108567537 n=1 Tax=Nicrophorus vespilloides TaxID=110193 RepID=A0ABM1N9Q9_NICVS|nr:PREDICTED: uncharacterized protein LOC108567537 [Nicrophorus vespilloides]